MLRIVFYVVAGVILLALALALLGALVPESWAPRGSLRRRVLDVGKLIALLSP